MLADFAKNRQEREGAQTSAYSFRGNRWRPGPAPQSSAPADRRHSVDALDVSAINMVQMLYEALEFRAAEHNSRRPSKDLIATTTPPQAVSEVVYYQPSCRDNARTVTTYRARISTRYWSLTLRGAKDQIDIYVLPADQVLGLARMEAEYEPTIRITPLVSSEKVHWIAGGQVLSPINLQFLAQNLIETLIQRCLADSRVGFLRQAAG